MARVTGQSLSGFFDQWLRRPGYPEVSATWTYDAAAHEATIRVTQASRFGLYRFPLTIAVTDSSGTTRRVNVDMSPSNPVAEARVTSGTRPSAVVLDPDVDLLAAVTVSNP
jgi:aminopeptidase N